MGQFKTRLDYDIFERPHYAFCVYHAARQAAALGIPKISVAEFGVAGGNGLVALENLIEEIEKEFGVEIEIYGFDTGEGLPAPIDYRDLPYIWKTGFYKMDQDALAKRINRSKLVLGEVKDTLPTFHEEHKPAPLGAAFFDVDFYSSTRDCFEIFKGGSETLLPRIYCYCDDVMSSEMGGILCDDVGQLLAIKEYNESHDKASLSQIHGLNYTRALPAKWNEQIYVHHAFDHPEYDTYVHPDKDRQLAL